MKEKRFYLIFDNEQNNLLYQQNKQKEQPTTDTYITNNDFDDGSWLENYIEIGQIEPEYFIYQNKYKVYRCGKTLWKRAI